MTTPINVSFLGLGVMGGAIARHIGKAGHRLTIYNRSPDRAARWQEANPGLAARVATSPAEAAEGADVVLTCVGNDDDLADVVLGPTGVFSTIRHGATFIDHTTVSARIARQIAVEARDPFQTYTNNTGTMDTTNNRAMLQLKIRLYFGFFLLMPWWSRIGEPKPVPSRVTFKPH